MNEWLIVERERKIEVTETRERISKHLIYVLKGTRGYKKIKEETLDCRPWKNLFGRDYGLFLRDTT